MSRSKPTEPARQRFVGVPTSRYISDHLARLADVAWKRNRATAAAASNTEILVPEELALVRRPDRLPRRTESAAFDHDGEESHSFTDVEPVGWSTSRLSGVKESLLSRRTAAPLLAALPVTVSALVSKSWSITWDVVLAQAIDELLSDVEDHLILDEENTGWQDDLGKRDVKGIVYHRLEGTLEDTDAVFRSGTVSALFDYGVDDVSGKAWRWNDALGFPHPNVRADRSPFANGPVIDPSSDTAAFIADNGIDAINRDQVSISIAGFFEDAISDECLETVAALTAYFANHAAIPWDVFPALQGRKSYGFVRWHNEIASNKPCPGPVVMNATPDIIARSRDLLRQIQDGA
jgi:hypothetical protein